MRRAMLLLFLVVVFLIPTQVTFAQGGSDMPPGCDFERVLDNFVTMIMESSDPEAALPAVEYLLERVETCGEAWLNLLLTDVLEPLISEMMGGMGGIDLPPDLLLAPDDGVLTSDEAEYAINQVFAGNLVEGNQFICSDEQVEEEDAPPFSFVNQVSCQEEDGAMSCYVDATVAGEPLVATVVFEIVDGRLCASETIEE